MFANRACTSYKQGHRRVQGICTDSRYLTGLKIGSEEGDAESFSCELSKIGGRFALLALPGCDTIH